MSIPGAGLSVINLLREQYEQRYGPGHGLSFRLLTAADFQTPITDAVSLYLYRVEVDPTRRHAALPPTPGQASRVSLAVDLRYMLTVWASQASRQHEVLSDCMSILDGNAVFGTDQLDGTYPWVDGTTVRVSLDALTNEDMLRLWDSLSAGYRLSVPYVVRTVRLPPVVQPGFGPVGTRDNLYVPGIP